MYAALYWVYYGITALLLLALLWSFFRTPDDTDPVRKQFPHELMMAALVLVPILLRLLGVK